VLAIAMITTYGGSMFPEIPYNDDTHPWHEMCRGYAFHFR
jgi:hypothetical protein